MKLGTEEKWKVYALGGLLLIAGYFVYDNFSGSTPAVSNTAAIAPGSASIAAASVAISCSSCNAGMRQAPGACSVVPVTSGQDT